MILLPGVRRLQHLHHPLLPNSIMLGNVWQSPSSDCSPLSRSSALIGAVEAAQPSTRRLGGLGRQDSPWRRLQLRVAMAQQPMTMAWRLAFRGPQDMVHRRDQPASVAA